jgi:hypothetical protein
VDRATCTYRTLWNAIKHLTGDLPAAEQALVLVGTAHNVYGV